MVVTPSRLRAFRATASGLGASGRDEVSSNISARTASLNCTFVVRFLGASPRPEIFRAAVVLEQVQQGAQRLAARPFQLRVLVQDQGDVVLRHGQQVALDSRCRRRGIPAGRSAACPAPRRRRAAADPPRRCGSRPRSRGSSPGAAATSPTAAANTAGCSATAASPRPTRPRSWCSWARPKRSACSITITVAAGTLTPTSITVVATSRSMPPSAKPAITASFSAAFILPCTSPTFSPNMRRRSSERSVAAARSLVSDSSTSGHTQ